MAAKVNIEKTEPDQTADEWRNWEQEIVKICYVCEKILFFSMSFFTRGHLREDINRKKRFLSGIAQIS